MLNLNYLIGFNRLLKEACTVGMRLCVRLLVDVYAVTLGLAHRLVIDAQFKKDRSVYMG
mgnify:CR=1 FL=1